MSLQSERVKQVATEIVRLSEDHDPREFLAALSIVTGIFIRQSWAKEHIEATIQTHTETVRELAKKGAVEGSDRH